jgi:hypothetical protein
MADSRQNKKLAETDADRERTTSRVAVEQTEEERHADNLRKAEQAMALTPPLDGEGDVGLERDETGRVVPAEGDSGKE